MKHLLLSMLLGLFILAYDASAQPEITLTPPEGEITEETVLRVSFPSPMVDELMLNKEAALSPLVFDPPLEGRFTWTSESTGEFTIEDYESSDQRSLKTQRHVRLRTELRDLQGQPVKAEHFGAVFSHAEFDITRLLQLSSADNADGEEEWVDTVWELDGKNTDRNEEKQPPKQDSEDESAENIPARPFYRIEFTRDIAGLDLKARTSFRDAETGENIPVEVVYESFQPISPNRSSWVITPKTALPPGRKWLLAIEHLPDAQKKETRRPLMRVIALGMSESFAVAEAKAYNYPGEGGFIHLEFNLNFDHSTAVPENFSVTPSVGKLRVEPWTYGLRVYGSFEQGKSYEISVSKAVCSVNGQPLTEAWKSTVTFVRKRPAVIMPDHLRFIPRADTLRYDFRQVNTKELTWRVAPIPLAVFEKVRSAAFGENADLLIGHADFGLVALQQGTFPSTENEVDAEKDRQVTWQLPQGQKAGTFLLEVTGQDFGGRRVGNCCIISVGDWTLVHKEADTHHFHALDVITGKPVQGLALITPRSEPEATVLPEDKNAKPDQSSTPKSDWTLVRTDAEGAADADDNFVVLTAQNALADPLDAKTLTDYLLWSGGETEAFWSDTDTDDNERLGTVCTVVKDRAVYRPGETFYFKGYLRIVERGVMPQIPEPAEYVWKIINDAGIVATGKVSSDEMGTLNGSWTIPAGAWGGYTLRLTDADAPKDDEGFYNTSISVREERPPAFSVIVTPQEKTGSQAQIKVQSTFFHGAPNAHAKVRWRAVWMNQWWLFDEESSTDSNGYYDGYLFFDQDSPYRELRGLSRSPGEAYFRSGWEGFLDSGGAGTDYDTPLAIVSGESEMNETGQVLITSPLPVKPERVHGRCRVSWSVEVVSTDGQAHDGSATSRVQLPPHILGVHTSEARKGVHIDIASFDYADQHLPGKRVRARLYRVDYKPLKETLSSGLVRYKNSPFYNKVWEKELETPVDLDVPVPTSGYYVTSVDDPLNPLIPQVSDASTFSTGEDAETPIHGPYDLGVRADKPFYRAGETGKFSINSPYAGTATISVETDRVLHSETIQLRSNLETFNLKMKPEWFPNAWVTVHLLRPFQGQTLPAERFGFTSFQLTKPELELQVEPVLDPPGGSTPPGAQVTGHVRVMADGQPVKDAEVLLYAVDEATLQMGRWALPDFHSKWFSANTHEVLTYPALGGDWEPSSFENLSESQKGYILGDGVTGGHNTIVRKKGQPVATWQPSLRTDAKGRAPFTFKATEDLTTFRIIAVATTKDSATGVGKTMLRQHKHLQVEPRLPRFVREGDLLHCRVALRQDFAPEAQGVRVNFLPDAGMEVLDPLRATSILSPTAASTVQSYRARVKPGVASLEVGFSAKASFGLESHEDAAAITLPVRPSVLDRQHLVAGPLESLQLESSLPQTTQGRCDLLVSSSPWMPTLDKLVRFEEMPHLTLEHAARLLRVLTAARLAEFLPPSPGSDNADAARVVKESIDAFRMADWKAPGLAAIPDGSKTDHFATLLSALALLSAAEDGHEVPQTLLEGLTTWVEDTALTSSDEDDDDGIKKNASLTAAGKAFACSVLARFAKSDKTPNWINHQSLARICANLYRDRKDIGLEGRAFLVLAFSRLGTGDEDVSELLDELAEPATPPADTVESGDTEHSTPMRTAGVCLLARATARGATWSPEQRLEEVARIEAALTSAGTMAPQEAIWWLMALDTIIKSVPHAKLAATEVRPRPDAVSENGTTLAWFNRPADALRRDFTSTGLGTTSGSWLLRVHGAESAAITAQASRSADGAAESGEPGLVMASSRINLTKSSRTGSKEAPFRIGDRILITYEFKSGQTRRFVQLDDQLPACLEPLGTDLATLADTLRVPDIIKRRAMKISSVERRDDRLVLVFDSISATADRYCVLARVNAAGEFHWPAPLIRSLYDGSLRTEGLDSMAYATE